MVVVEPVRPPIRVPRWPSAAEAEPDFAAIRAEFEVPEEFPADVARRGGPARGPAPAARARRDRRPPRDPGPRRQPRSRSGRAPGRPGDRLPGHLRDRRRRRVRGARQRARPRGPAPRADALQPRPADAAAPAGAQRGGGQPAPRRRPARRRLDHRPRCRRRAGRGAGAPRRGSAAAPSWTIPRSRPRPTPERCPSRWPCCPGSAPAAGTGRRARRDRAGHPRPGGAGDPGRELDPRLPGRPARRGVERADLPAHRAGAPRR